MEGKNERKERGKSQASSQEEKRNEGDLKKKPRSGVLRQEDGHSIEASLSSTKVLLYMQPGLRSKTLPPKAKRKQNHKIK